MSIFMRHIYITVIKLAIKSLSWLYFISFKGIMTCLMSLIFWCCSSFTMKRKSTTGSQVSLSIMHMCVVTYSCSCALSSQSYPSFDLVLDFSFKACGSAASLMMPGGSAWWRTRSPCSQSIQIACSSVLQWSMSASLQWAELDYFP